MFQSIRKINDIFVVCFNLIRESVWGIVFFLQNIKNERKNLLIFSFYVQKVQFSGESEIA
jgi:hypothetical protein